MSITASIKPSTQPRPVTLQWDDFSGGLNADSANYPLTLAENELADVLNYKYTRQGGKIKLKSRDGLTKVSTAGTAGGAIYDIAEFTASDGTSYTCVVADSDLKRLDTGAFTKVIDLASTRGRMCVFNGKLVVASGGMLKYWDGSSFLTVKDSNDFLMDNITGQTAIDSAVGLYTGSYLRFGAIYTTPNWLISETFTTLTVVFGIRKVGAPTGAIAAKIYNTSGALIGTATAGFDVASEITTSFVNKTFTFSNIALDPATSYYVAIVFTSTSSDASNLVLAAVIDYTGNNTVKYDSSWSTQAGDCYIKISPKNSPLASFVINKKDRVYCNNSVYPNRLYYCNNNDITDYSTIGGGGYIIFDGHYKLNGVYVYYDEIYVFADNPKAIYKLTGDSPDEYVVKLMWRDVTAESQDVIQDVGSDLLFKDTRGFISLRTMEKYGDIEKSIISKDKVNNTYILPYTTPRTGKVTNDNQCWVTTTSNYILVYDQEYNIWTLYQLELGTGVTPTSFGLIAGVTYIGCSDGNLYYLDYTKDQDNAVDFSLVAKTPWTDLGTLMEKDARYADSIMVSGSQETYDLELYKNMDDTTAAKTINTVSLTRNGAFETPGCGHLNEVNFNFKQIQAKITNISSGTGPHYLDRIAIETNILSRY